MRATGFAVAFLASVTVSSPAAAQVLYCGRTIQEWRQLAVHVIDERNAACTHGHSIDGTTGPDLILGSACADRIDGGPGDDCIYGMAGDDFLRGRPGDDEIHGGAGRDRIFGDSGHDRLYGDAGDDFIKGEAGTDELHGGDGHDTLYGGSGRDMIFGDGDEDSIWADSGRDRVFGGDGADQIRGDAGHDLLCGGAGFDFLYGDSGGDRIDGGPDDARCDGGDRFLPRFLRNNDCWRCQIEPSRSCEPRDGALCEEPAAAWCADGYAVVAGECDGGAGCGRDGRRERPAPRPALYAQVYEQAAAVGGGLLDFDEVPGVDGVGAPGHFAHSFTDLPSDVCGGRLEITLLGGPQAGDDRLALGLVDGDWAWEEDLDLAPGGGSTRTYDLEDLGGVLGAMSDGSLDVQVSEQVGVDCMRLCLQTGCPHECPDGSAPVSGTFKWNWTEKQLLTEATTDCTEVLAHDTLNLAGTDPDSRFAELCEQRIPGSEPLSWSPRACRIDVLGDHLFPFEAILAVDGCCTLPAPPDLELDKKVTDAGDLGALYTLDVRNRGAGATDGPITVVDTLPPGVGVEGISAPGWSCTESEDEGVAVVTCVYTGGPVGGGEDLPPIEILVLPPHASGENCARVDTPGDGEHGNDLDCVDTTPPDEPCSDPSLSLEFSVDDYETCEAAAAAVPDDLERFDMFCERGFGDGSAAQRASLLSCADAEGAVVARVRVCCGGEPLCAAGETQASTSGLHFPRSTTPDCAAAITQAEADLDSFHYRKACQDALGGTLPDVVGDAVVTHCEETDRSLVIAADVCCLPAVERCEGDDDCAPDGWCAAGEGGGECEPFVGEGGRCGGRTVRPGRCAPGFVCTDWPEETHDVPGFCRREEEEEEPECWDLEAPATDAPWRLARRAGGSRLLARLGGEASPDEVRLRVAKRTAAKAAATHLPAGWSLTRKGGTLTLRGPAHDSPLHFALDFGPRPVPDRVGLETLRDGSTLERRRDEQVAALPAPAVADRLEGLLTLPARLSPGRTVLLRPRSPARTPAGGRWSVGGEELRSARPGFGVACLPERVRELLVELAVPVDWRPGRRVAVRYDDPWGETLVDVPDAGVEIAPPEPAAETAEPRIDTVSAFVVPGGQACLCGSFPSTEARTGLLLDDRQLATPLAASDHQVHFEVPGDLALGAHQVSGRPDAGYPAGDPRPLTAVRVEAQLDREELMTGGSTRMRLRVVGTEEAVPVRVVNRTPEVVRLEGGDDRSLTTSGGADNSLSLPVRALRRGDFDIEWSLPGCPCEEGGDRR